MAPWTADMKAKNTSGTQGNFTGKEEYAVNLEIALKIRDLLQSQGATVIMTRSTNNVSLSNQERAAVANKNQAHLCISIHCNSADNPDVTGIEVYSRGKGDGTDAYAARSSAESALATKLVSAVCEATGAKNRGAKLSDSYTGINYSEVPWFILECGFMSNSTEDNLLSSADYQNKIAVGILNFVTAAKSSLIK